MSSEMLVKEINSLKEVLSTMPVNNKRNRDKYKEYVLGLLEDYKTKRELVLGEIKKQYSSIMKNVSGGSYSCSLDTIDEYWNDVMLVSSFNSGYEKSGLDRVIDCMEHFYEDDFDSFNESLKEAVLIFKNVGVKLKKEDFCYSPFAMEYMSLFLNYVDGNGDVSLVSVRECFDDLYWKCHNIIFHIVLNFKYLYFKYKRFFDSYYKCERGKILKGNVDVYSRYKSECGNYLKDYYGDIGVIVNGFLDGKYNINDYSEEKILKCYSKLGISKEIDIEVIYELYCSLMEYKGYNNFLFILNEVRERYHNRDKYKDVFKKKMAAISSLEKKIIKLNRKVRFKNRFNVYEGKIDKLVVEIEKLIDEVHQLYKEIDEDKFNQFVMGIGVDVSIYDVLMIANSYYMFLKKCISDTGSDVDGGIRGLNEFLRSGYVNIINNISFDRDFDMAMVISDRYKLLGFDISSDDISGNVDSLIDDVFKIILENSIEKSGVSYEDILFLVKVRDLVD